MREWPLLHALSSSLPSKGAPNLHRVLVFGGPGQLPEFVNYCLAERFFVLTLQGLPEFHQENLPAPARGNVNGPLAAALVLIAGFLDVLIA